MAETDDFAELVERAMAGDQEVQAFLWSEFRRHMHRVIRLKAADLRLEWAVDPDDIYDSFFLELFKHRRSIQFENALHFSNYVEKSVRRRTRKTLRAWSSRFGISLETCPAVEPADADSVDELTWAELLDEASAKLTQRERDICLMLKAGHRWREVGRRLGLTEDNARMIHRRALARISDLIHHDSAGRQLYASPSSTSRRSPS